MSTLPILNIAAYKFVPLTDLGRRRRELREFCSQQRLRGTVLLSEEGINLFVAGHDDAVESLVDLLEKDGEIGTLEVKRSRSQLRGVFGARQSEFRRRLGFKVFQFQ